MDVSEAKRMKTLEDENAKLKRLLADTMLDNAALKNLLGNRYGPPRYCKVFVSDAPTCVNVSGLCSVSRFWRQGLDYIRPMGSILVALDHVPLLSPSLPWSINRLVVHWLTGDACIAEKHVPCNGFCGEGSAQAAAPFDRRQTVPGCVRIVPRG